MSEAETLRALAAEYVATDSSGLDAGHLLRGLNCGQFLQVFKLVSEIVEGRASELELDASEADKPNPDDPDGNYNGIYIDRNDSSVWVIQRDEDSALITMFR